MIFLIIMNSTRNFWMNSFGIHEEIHTHALTQSTRNLRSVIDHLIMKQKTKVKVQDEEPKDHRLFKTKIL